MRARLATLGFAIVLPIVLGPPFLVAEGLDELYRARAIVTGTRAETRPAGLANCIEDVLVKVSGDPRLIGDPRLAPIKAEAEKYVTAIDYHDHMEGIPYHDEQGSRDRPFDLICTFDHASIDALLRSLGERPWTTSRPRLAVFLGVRTARGSYVLTSDGERGRDQRESLAAAAYKLGMPVVLPDAAVLGERPIDFAVLAADKLPPLDAAARAAGGDIALAGTLDWSDRATGWISRWRCEWRGRTSRWGASGISFDEAFRRGVGGAEQVLSGRGAPP